MAPEQTREAEVVAPRLRPSSAAVIAQQPVVAVAASALPGSPAAQEVVVAAVSPAAKYQKYFERWNP